MKKWVLLFLLACSVMHAQNSQELFDAANTLYKEGKYQQAIEGYKSLIENNQVSSELYYNVGNCFYKLNQVAPAIYNYEKALQLNPNNKDVKNNLIFAKRLTIDRIEALPKSIFQKFEANYIQKLHVDYWGMIAVLFAFISVILFLLFYFSYSSTKKRFFFTLSIISVLLLIISFSIGFQQYQKKIDKKEAIIFAEEIAVQSEPTTNADEVFTLHEGTKVLVLDTVDEWNKIKLVNGKIGWLKSIHVKLLSEF